MEIDGRIAMAGDEADAIAQTRPRPRRQKGNIGMLVGYSSHVRGVSPEDTRQARFRRVRFEAGVGDDAVRSRNTHDSCVNEQALGKFRTVPAVRIQIARVVPIHEDVGTNLQFVVEATCRLESVSARSSAANDSATQPLPLQTLYRPRYIAAG